LSATGLLYTPLFLEHTTGIGHPEAPRRLSAILNRLERTGLINELTRIPLEPVDRTVLESIHPVEYISHIETACITGKPFVDSPDCAIGFDSYSVALAAAGASVQGVKEIMTGTMKNGMVLTRPPGHHAETSAAMGFCLFNNIALAAIYALSLDQIEKVAILDFDVHHGNGTQHIFEENPGVLYISTHQFPFFPGTGNTDEIGCGAGKGLTHNYPLEAETGDRIFMDIYRNSIPDLVLNFKPDLILLSAGFDAHRLDPIGGLQISTEAFTEIAGIFKNLANECCDGRLLSILEGGYSFDALAESVYFHLKVLMQ